MSNPTRTLAQKVVETTADHMPKDAIEMTKQVFFDSIGCALGGHAVEKGKIITEFTRETSGKPQATVIGGHLTSYPASALANGDLIDSLDFAMVSTMAGHSIAYVMPPCLAMAEGVHASGMKILEALTLGLEIADRVQSSIAQHFVQIDDPPYYKENDRFSYGMPIFGGVAAAAKIVGLDAARLAHAFGIAGASMPVPASQKWEHNAVPGIMTKYNCWSGWVSQLATTAVLLAEKDFTGDDTILDGDWGLWKIVASPYFREGTIFDGFASKWHTAEKGMKPYPCYRAATPAIEAIIGLIRENGINPDDIERIVVNGPPPIMFPNRTGTIVLSSMDVPFVNRYLFAVACYFGEEPGPRWHQRQTYTHPKILKLMQKVDVGLHPKARELIAGRVRTGGVPLFADTNVGITAGGRRFTKDISRLKGSYPNLMTWGELEAKFRLNASYSSLRQSRIDEAIRLIQNLETLDDVTQLTRLLTAG